MPMYKPSELRLFLSELGITPKKFLSQNFLIDGNIIRKIVEEAQTQPGDVILEIGSGPGSLSEALLDKGATVLAVEKDEVLAQALERLKSPTRKLEIFCDDILKFPIEEEIVKHLGKNGRAKVIANLPYHLTTPILVRLAEMRHIFSSVTVMVQEEVARRFTAAPGTAEYGSFSVFLNFFTNPHYAFTVSNHCFYPEPSIQSAVVTLHLKQPPTVSNQEQFFILTRTAFSHRRKMLRASLRELYAPEQVMAALSSMNLNPQARPEELSLANFLCLFEKLFPSADISAHKEG